VIDRFFILNVESMVIGAINVQSWKFASKSGPKPTTITILGAGSP